LSKAVKDGEPYRGLPSRGVYQLVIRLERETPISVGRLGRFLFPPGLYIYTGRAKRGLGRRIARHYNRGQRRFWHIDYLLAAPSARLLGAIVSAAQAEQECFVHQQTGKRLGAESLVLGFGSSDCKSGCESHLWFVRTAMRDRE